MADSILPSNATVWERAVERASAERWAALAPDALTASQDADTCPAELLPWLAHSRGVDLWYEDWAEDRKRRITAEMPELARSKGTVEALRRYLSFVDGALTYTVAPADELPLIDPPDADSRRERQRQPELRIYPFRDPVPPRGTRLDEWRLDDAVAVIEPSLGKIGERVFLSRGGAEERLDIVAREDVLRPDGVRVERLSVAIPALRGSSEIVTGRTALLAPEATHVLTVDLQPATRDADLHPVPFSRRVVGGAFERVNDHVPGEIDLFIVGSDPVDGTALTDDPAPDYVYRRLYVAPPDQPSAAPERAFVLGRDMISPPPFYLTAGVDVDEVAGGDDRSFVMDHTAVDGAALIELDTTQLQRAVAAARAAQGGTDIYALDTRTFRPWTLGDGVQLSEGLRLGQMMEAMHG